MKKIQLILGFAFVTIMSNAQTKLLKGSVMDSNGIPIKGAIISSNSGKEKTQTDESGMFQIQASENLKSLIINHSGFSEQNLDIENQTDFTIVLEKEKNKEEKLTEVVVTAIGVKREKKSLGYSVQEVSGKSLAAAQTVSPLNALAGQVAGLNVSGTGSGPGGSVKLLLRGANSITGNNEPLYVIDGVPLDNTTQNNGRAGGGFDYGNAANNINPDDIESISVLKGGAAAALYGSRGANGVVMITTKQGKKGGKLSVNLKSSTTISSVLVTPNLQNNYSQGTGGQLRLGETQSWGTKMQGQEFTNFLGQQATLNPNSENPFDTFYKNGYNLSNSISVTKGLDKGNFYISASNLNSDGVIPNETFKKFNSTMRLTYDLNDYITIETKANIINQQAKNRPNLLDSPDNPAYNMLYIPRSVTMNQLKDYKTTEGFPVIFNKNYTQNPNGISFGSQDFPFAQTPLVQNPYWTSNLNTNEDIRKRFIGYAKLDFNLLKMMPKIGLNKFNFMVRGGVDYYTDQRRNQVHDKTIYKAGGLATLSTFKGDFIETNYDFLISGFKQLTNFGISSSLGANLRNNDSNGTTSGSESGIINPFGNYVLNNFKNIQTTEHRLVRREMQSVYGTFSIDYKKMFYLDLTGRNDWTSTINPNDWSFFYPSASLSWILNETFKLPKEINFLKLRSAYAEVGNDLGPSEILFNYTINSNQYQGLPFGGIPSVQPNYNILPEITKSWEFGLESRLFNNKINMDFTYYRSGTDRQIFNVPVAASSGFKAARVNAGFIQNSGLELSLKTSLIKKENINLGVVFNVSRTFSEVKNLDAVDLITVQEVRVQGGLPLSIDVRKGLEPGTIIGTKFNRDSNGNLILDDKNLPTIKKSNGVDALENLGNVLPKWIAGFGINFNYKGFFTDVFIDGKFGNKLFSYTNLVGERNGVLESTEDGRDAWEQAKLLSAQTGISAYDINGKEVQGTKNGILGTYYTDPQEYFDRLRQINEAYIYDASFIRLQRVSLGYNIKKEFVNKIGLENMSISIVGSNLAYLMKKTPNITPNSAFTTGTFGGAEIFAYPETRNIGFSVSLDF